jgi:hypothetical protein
MAVINPTMVQRLVWIAFPGNIKQNNRKQAALIAALISLQQQQLGLLVNLVQLDNTLWQMAVPRVNHAAPVHLVPVVKNAPVVFFDRRKTRI